jgi:phosphoserine aminotransferase
MTKRAFNFSAGPAMLPDAVLKASAEALLDYQGKGVGIAECSHRGKEFDGVLDEAISLCRELLSVPDSHDILFLQGGATQLFNTIPMNFLGGGVADYVVSGQWSQKAFKSAKKAYGDAIRLVASSEETGFDRHPENYDVSGDAAYLHVCSNETVHGHRVVEWPHHKALVVDASSEMMSRPHPIDRTALVYAGAQKNLGPAGVVLAIVRKDLYDRIDASVPDIFNFEKHAAAKSCLNTPPTFGIYVLLETFRWLKSLGGLAKMEEINAQKAKLVYDAVDGSGGFYQGTVSVPAQRSHMNVTFRLAKDELTDAFIKGAAQQNMVALKGYRSVGGIRASIYNAMPVEGCQALADFMGEFARQNG